MYMVLNVNHRRSLSPITPKVSARDRFVRVSARLGLVFSRENETLGLASITESLGSASLSSPVYTHDILYNTYVIHRTTCTSILYRLYTRIYHVKSRTFLYTFSRHIFCTVYIY